MQLTQAPAKINLALHVTGQRADGYHLLDTIAVFASTIHASDTIIVGNSARDGFHISGPFAEKLQENAAEENLIIRARDHVRDIALDAGTPTPPIHISLVKRLPIAAGLGGGSADAAATFKALYRYWEVGYHPQKSGTHVISELLGADVPMCLLGKPLRATGIGEEVSTIPDVPRFHMVLINCGEMIPTSSVYSALEDKENAPIDDYPENSSELISFLKTRTRNDLQPAAIEKCPAINACIDALDQKGAMLSRMSGSGATCFGIFPSAVAANAAARQISKSERSWWAVATTTSGSTL